MKLTTYKGLVYPAQCDAILTTHHTLPEVDGSNICADIVLVSVYFDLENRLKKAIPGQVRRGTAKYICPSNP